MNELLVFFIGAIIGLGILAVLALFYLVARELLREIRKVDE